MSLNNLPNDCLLACLARVPYADLRNAIPSTSKQLRDAVASAAFRKTRELAGCVEYGVFATPWEEYDRTCYLITESGARRTAPRPPNQELFFITPLQNEVVVTRALSPMRSHAYNAGQNTWREIPPLIRDLGGRNYDKLAFGAEVGSIGSNLVVIGGGMGDSIEPFKKRMDAYDPVQDTWSRLPDLPFHCDAHKIVEADGKLYCLAGYRYGTQHEDRRRTFVYDPTSRTWTNGPRLPYEPWIEPEEAENIWHFRGFEVSSCLCIMGKFSLAPDDIRYLAFVWDPTREAWDDFPVPPVIGSYVGQVDGHIVVSGWQASDDEDHDFNSTRLFVFGPGSRHWTEWDIPAGFRFIGPRYAAVRIG